MKAKSLYLTATVGQNSHFSSASLSAEAKPVFKYDHVGVPHYIIYKIQIQQNIIY